MHAIYRSLDTTRQCLGRCPLFATALQACRRHRTYGCQSHAKCDTFESSAVSDTRAAEAGREARVARILLDEPLDGDAWADNDNTTKTILIFQIGAWTRR